VGIGEQVFSATAGQSVAVAMDQGNLWASSLSSGWPSGPDSVPQINIELIGGNGPTGPVGPAGSIMSVSSSDSTITTTTISGAVNVSIPTTLRPAVIFAGYYTFTDSTWSSFSFDFQNYDYEATIEIGSIASTTWIYFLWNNNTNMTYSGDLIYPSGTGGGADGVNTTRYGSYDGSPYTLYSGTNDGSSGTRTIIATYRFHGLSQNVFTMNAIGSPHLSWQNGYSGTYPPQSCIHARNTTYYTNVNGVPSNNSAWGPTHLKISSAGVSYSGKMTWRRLNKTS